MGDTDFKTEEASAGIHFTPPLYTQRYVLALKILTEHNIKSVVDFGCAECGFFKLLPTALCVERAALVDIDKSLLVAKKGQIDPQLHHYIQRRKNPLKVSLFCGSAEQTDPRIQHFESATLIEVIEHLHPEVLIRVTENVFGRLRPRLCFVTTPNAEFNVLFKNPDPTQFRHWDHKFEWTRSEFSAWCEHVSSQFGYNVKYTGVGEITSDPDSCRLGPCSQAAVFILETPTTGLVSTKTSLSPPTEQGDDQTVLEECYELIAEAEFPYVKDDLSDEEKLDLEVSFCLRELVRNDESNIPYGEELAVSVARLAEYRSVKALAGLEGVKESLERQHFTLSPDRNHVLIVEQDSLSEGELEDDIHLYSLGVEESLCETSGSEWGGLRTNNLNIGLDNECKTDQSQMEEEENWDDFS